MAANFHRYKTLTEQISDGLTSFLRANVQRVIDRLPTAVIARPRVIVGTSSIVLILAASRWGTYIGTSPIFLTDILILLGIVAWGIARITQGPRPLNSWVPGSRPSALYFLFFSYVVLRLVFSIGNSSLLLWIRDGAPFLYGFLAFVSAASLARSSAEARSRTMVLIWWALVAHLVWAVLALAAGNNGIAIPALATPIFQVRPDIDGAILGITAGMALISIFKSRHKFWIVVMAVTSIGAVLSMNTRAGFISLALSLGMAWMFYQASVHDKKRRLLSQALIPLLLIIGLVSVPFTPPGQRLLATIDASQNSSLGQQNAQGTERARTLVWTGVIKWTGESTGRTIFGSGFGNDFLAESGTLAYLEGTTYDNVRSPHNWFIGNYARLGVIGLGLSVLICLELGTLIIRNRKRFAEDKILALSAFVVVAIIPVASLGVVLEAPFGAVPFWWAAGLIYTLHKTRQNRVFSETDSPMVSADEK